MVDLAGPMVEVVLGSVAILSAHVTSPGIEQALLFGIGVSLWESALINLYPFSFLEMDGYNILADSIGHADAQTTGSRADSELRRSACAA